MLSVPLPFIAGLVIAAILFRSLNGVDVPGSRRYLNAFLCLYAVQGMIIGLRFGYDVRPLSLVQPVTAAIMPPLAYLTFRAMSSAPVARPWPHALPPLLLALGVAFAPFVVDALLLLIFLGYAGAIWQLTRREDMTEAALQKTSVTVRAARVTALLLAFFALTDALLASFTFVYGNAYVPMAVTGMNIGAIVIVSLYYWWPERAMEEKAAAPAAAAPLSDDDAAALARISAALEADALFAQENLSLARLARKAGMPARDVSALINRATGLNVSQYVNNRRIGEACRLLQDTDKPLMTVMFDSGFSTKSNFNREFRRVTGQSPSQWRSAMQGARKVETPRRA
ncbi:AraC family transcriptional regulator [Rhizobium sp. SSA_523]|uniref:helix-turn-helix domain-containing protein n=1 Tax=Rhizobium sp. SSA_523 TaxID=2952477 RepID=UPI002091B8CA|nr:AraC family transcriptional regulator [Rhizobium sp. SSA_523]MCO5732643.1 AraC family transcriptional regulator [Rhizobium sp. SSA_523]WKC23725.1 AraC family transcriptional regulator [Rhizobium sp. SSA_523]